MDPLNKEFVSLLQISGWRAKRAAMELCLDPGTVSRYLSGDVKPSMTVLKLFGRLLGEPLRYVESNPPQPFEAQPLLDADEIRLFRQLRALHPQQRRRLLAAIGELVESLAPPPWSSPSPSDTVGSESPKAGIPADILEGVEAELAEKAGQINRPQRRGKR